MTPTRPEQLDTTIKDVASVIGGSSERLCPPLDLTSDMLFVLALCPTAPLRKAFRSVKLLSIMGRTPLVVWFSRTNEACYRTEEGEQRCLRDEHTIPYNEMTIIALLRERAVFVPCLFATSELSVTAARELYGMDKLQTAMTWQARGRRFRSTVSAGPRPSFVRARLVGSGRLLTKLVSLALPRRMWPARFPSGSELRVQVQAVRRAQVALVKEGQLSVGGDWLRKAVPLLPIGLYAHALRMRLPVPGADDGR